MFHPARRSALQIPCFLETPASGVLRSSPSGTQGASMRHALRSLSALAVATTLVAGAAHGQRPIDILHTPVTEAIEGKDVEINANIRRYRDVQELFLYYRVRGAPTYNRTAIPRSSSDFYE